MGKGEQGAKQKVGDINAKSFHSSLKAKGS